MNEIKPTHRERAVTASHATARALANDSLLSVVLRDNTTAVRLGMVEPADSNDRAIGQTFVRAISDAVAMVETYHDAAIHKSLSPDSALRLRLFNEMEWIRCEAAGSANLKGVASNLTYLWHKRHPEQTLTTNPTATQTLSLLTRHALNLTVNNTEALNNAKQMLPNEARDNFLELPNHIFDQAGYATISLAIIEALEQLMQMMLLGTNVADEDDNTSVAIDAPDTYNEEQKRKEDETDARESDEDPTASLLTDVIDKHFEDDNDTYKDSAVNTLADSTEAGTPEGEPYTSYSQSEDEVVHAREICSQKELAHYREKLDEHIQLHKRVVGKLSGQLQRVLMAQQNRHWKFDLEQGALDTARLTRIVTRPTSSLAFKQESDSAFKDTIVTLLVDNSRSMDGMPIATAAACADILSQTLERCGVSVEILGFTTTELHGGKLFRDWKSAGRAAQPGRLNGLRHIIYKSADVPYRRARNEFGLMLNKDILKQNIDGESLLWAVKRLSIRPETRKILLVISDGAPLDSSTMSANRNNYLSDHLHKVIDDIECRAQIELAAVGIGHDVSKYYRHAITIRDVRYLGKTLLTQLKSLFAAPDGRRQHS